MPIPEAQAAAIAEHDIVQLVDDAHPWYPCLLVVIEVKSWGVQAYAHVVDSNEAQNQGQAYNRLKWDQIERVGRAVIC